MQDNGALVKVDLSGNNGQISSGPDFIRPIANALKANTSITEINLSNNKLNAEAAEVLSDGIMDAKGALVTLDISRNAIGAEGAKHLAPALQEW